MRREESKLVIVQVINTKKPECEETKKDTDDAGHRHGSDR